LYSEYQSLYSYHPQKVKQVVEVSLYVTESAKVTGDPATMTERLVEASFKLKTSSDGMPKVVTHCKFI